jgi:undecaprenyl-diphosphatase
MFPEGLQHIDEQVFILINQRWGNAFFDLILPPIRDKLFWIPAYVIIAILILYKWRTKGLLVVALILANFALSDQVSSAVIKPAVGRLRPCNDPDFAQEVHLRIDACGAGKSFTSSHATNTFAFAVISILLFRKKYRWVTPVALTWATAVSYAQVYVGVHYPLDILGGALLGTIMSIILYNIASRYLLRRYGPELNG